MNAQRLRLILEWVLGVTFAGGVGFYAFGLMHVYTAVSGNIGDDQSRGARILSQSEALMFTGKILFVIAGAAFIGLALVSYKVRHKPDNS